MTGPESSPPPAVRRVLRSLLPGARGAEILHELDREYAAIRARRARAVAWLWYLLQTLRPATWRLAWALRRIHQAEEGREGKLGHEARGRLRASGLTLDLKLAWRMLLNSPGLTVVALLGITLGTALAVGFFVFLSGFLYPTLPLEEGTRIVALENWDVLANEEDRRSLHDFVMWREEMRSVEQVSAASQGSRSLVTGDSPPRPVRGAEMTASGFRLARVPPLLGRHLVPEDETHDAPGVAVIGYELWRTSFAADPSILGRRILLDGAEHAVVGVMPAGFAFPENEELWTALRASPTRQERGRGPELFVFGRLAPGATREQAQAELTALGRRPAAAFPEANARVHPRVLPFTYPLDNVRDVGLWEAAQVQLMVTLLWVAIAGNVAVLVYARTAMRQGEMALRAALGASRRRIVAQLFLEALLLSTMGATLGLALGHVGLEQLMMLFDAPGEVSFWVDYGLQPRSIIYGLALAVLGAVIVGVLPGLGSTGRRMGVDLRRIGGGASARLGWAWTALIVAQVGVAVTVLPTALHHGFDAIRMAAVRATFPAQDFLTVGVGLAAPIRPGVSVEDYRREAAARFAGRLAELERRLEAEPAVAGVTFEGSLPLWESSLEVEGGAGDAATLPQRVPSYGVAADYLGVLGARFLAGRDLRASDAVEQGRGVVVSEAFVRDVLSGGEALGRRVRFQTRAGAGPQQGGGTGQPVPGPWLEIVGVTEDLYASALDRRWAPALTYHAVGPEELTSAKLLVRVRAGDRGAFAPRLRQVTRELDLDLHLGQVENLATLRSARFLAAVALVLVFALTAVLLLSAAGVHALVSLTVTRRRREIGVRTALGARRGRVVASVFSRAAWQLGLGGFLGSLLGGVLLLGSGVAGREAAVLLSGVLALMVMVGLVAVVGPARRGLGIQPMEALRED